MTEWNGTDASGRYKYPADQITRWTMQIDEAGNVYYITGGRLWVWCTADRLTRHLHHLEQIDGRR